MYEPLDPSRREIRLLQIVEGSDDGPIRCELCTVSLDDIDFEFAALSYVWGDESVTRDVVVNGQQRAVTVSLESALRNFWHNFKENAGHAIRRFNLVSSMVDEPNGLTRLRGYLASESCDLRHESDLEDGSEDDGENDDRSDAEDESEDEGGDKDEDGDEDEDGNEDEDDAENEDADEDEDGNDDGDEDEDDGDDEDGNEDETDGDGTASINLQAHFKDGLMAERILSAHRRARVGGSNLPIWIDALCINQKDAVEKGHQIPMMREIYAKAACVFSWLGPSDDRKVDLALRTIRKLAVRLHSDGYSKTQLKRDHPELCAIHYHHPPFNEYWEAILNFANSEYFQRLWIFQELWATNGAVFLCGDEYLPMTPLIHYHDWATSLSQDNITSPPLTIPLFNSITQVYRMKAGFKGAPLKSRVFLDIVGKWRCKDPRDKVFALFGIFPMDITPDYTMPVADVYANWATNSSQDLPLASLLFYSGIGLYPRTSDSHNLASWQPDFEMLGEQRILWALAYANRYLDTKIPDHFQPTISPTRHFTCFGVQITKVREIATRAARKTTTTPLQKTGKDSLPTRQSLLPVLKYLIANKHTLWTPDYHKKGSPLWKFIQTVNECVDGGVPLTEDLTPDMLLTFSLYNLVKEAQKQTMAHIDGPDGFTADELALMGGFGSEGELWACLGDLPKSSNLDEDEDGVESQGTGPEDDALSQFVSRLWVFAVAMSLFHTEDGCLGAGPPGMEEGDLVYLVQGVSLPVLVREVEGRFCHVGVCFISGISGAESLRVLGGRQGDVGEVELV